MWRTTKICLTPLPVSCVSCTAVKPFCSIFPPMLCGSASATARRARIHTIAPETAFADAVGEQQLPWLRHNLRHLMHSPKSGSGALAKMSEGSMEWPRFSHSPRCCGVIYDPPNESKLAFLTAEKYCRLCREPVEALLGHCAWWDHVTRMFALRLIAMYPRRWDPQAVTHEAQGRFPPTVMAETRPHPFLPHSARRPHALHPLDAAHAEDREAFLMDLRVCYTFERDAVVRRAELAALLRVLSAMNDPTGSGRRPPLRAALHLKNAGSSMANLGERTFRAFISEQITILLPPMAPEATTRIQQRCWGRKNLEMMFDLLGVGALQRLAGVKMAAETKNEKAGVLRQVIYELDTLFAESEVRGDDSLALLAELTLRRLAHELIHLHTMVLMERTWETYVELGWPTPEEMEESSFC